MTGTKRCKGCIYSGYDHGDVICDYIGIVGHKRPCLPGKDCTVRKTGDKARARPDIWLGKQRKWNTVKAEAMRAEGKTYPAIAAELGTTQAAVQSYFQQKRKPGREKVSNPRHQWHGNVIRTIRYYPALEEKKRELVGQAVTAGYSGMPKPSEPSRTTEACAMRHLSPREEEEVDAVRGAIIEIRHQQDGEDILKIVNMVDWKKTHTIDGAAGNVNVSPRTAKRMRGRFVLAVARRLRYI